MRLLAKSVLRHMKNHLLQTVATIAVAVLVTGMAAVVFNLTSSFQYSLRTKGLEKGSWHYRYCTDTGTESERFLHELKEQFAGDTWFSDVMLQEEKDDRTALMLTVRHPNIFMSKTMEKKFNEVEESYRQTYNGMLEYGYEPNSELLFSCGDLSKENSLLLLLFVFIGLVTLAAVLTIGALFQVSAMQREREFALLSGIGAAPLQLAGMALMESIFYCVIALPSGFFLGIFVYRLIQKYLDSICQALFYFPLSDLTVSVSWSTAFFACSMVIILLSGLKAVGRAAHTSPVEVLGRTKEIQVRKREKNVGNVYERRVAAFADHWLAKKSYRRFRRKNRSVFVMLSITFALCLVLSGIRRYATEIVEMRYSGLAYNYDVELFSENREELETAAKELMQLSGGQLKAVKQATFELRSPYPVSDAAVAVLKSGYLPTAMLLCIDEKSFRDICREIGIPEDREGIWGIFLDTERTWYDDDEVLVKDKPFQVAAGDRIRLLSEIDFRDRNKDKEAATLEIAGVYGEAPLYTETNESLCMQILVPEKVFSQVETKRSAMEIEEGTYRISLRGNLEDERQLDKEIKKQMEDRTGIIWHINNDIEQEKIERDGIYSFELLCALLIAIFVFICSCGNFTVSWAENRARDREYATLLSVGMTPRGLLKMRLFEALRIFAVAFCTGAFCGGICYQVIYKICRKGYRIHWMFPWEGLLLGIMALMISVGITNAVLEIGNGKRVLAERLRIDE